MSLPSSTAPGEERRQTGAVATTIKVIFYLIVVPGLVILAVKWLAGL
jgi:hypothetical protein